MTSSLSQFDAYLKERYPDDRVQELMFPDNVLLGRLTKKSNDPGFSGDSLIVPIQYAFPQGVSKNFSTAQSVSNSSGGNTAQRKFVIEPGQLFGVVSIDDKTMTLSRSNPGAFLTAKTHEIDGLYEQMGEVLSQSVWGNGGNSLGVAATYVSGNDITLATTYDVANFEVGMYVATAANDGSTSTDTIDAGSAQVTAVNYATGVITVDNAASLTGLATGRNFFRLGDFNGNTSNVIMKGVQAFITGTDSPGALWGVTAAQRAVQPQRWAGCRLASTAYANKGTEERLRKLGSAMTGVFKAKGPSSIYMNPEDWTLLENQMISRGTRDAEEDDTEFGYLKIMASCGGKKVPVYQDRHCPKGTAFALREENWWISTAGELIAPMNEDGFEMLRKADDAAYELRLKSYPLLACNAPLYNGRVPVGT
jgi:hypothetical protein